MKCARDVADLIKYETPGEVACFIAEPIQGVGGVVTPPREYFEIVYEIVRKHGGLCIADEVQTGFGRTGTAFWGFENWGVTPDLVTLAKGIGNGVPFGACVTRPEIARVMKNRIHFNTFGGNPISMTQGLATLEVIDSEGIQQNALAVGKPSEGTAARAAGTSTSDRRGSRHGTDAGRRAGARPALRRNPQSARPPSLLELCKERGLLDRQGRSRRKHAADQAADVPDTGRCGLSGGLPGRSADLDLCTKISAAAKNRLRCEKPGGRSAFFPERRAARNTTM